MIVASFIEIIPLTKEWLLTGNRC